MKKTTKKKVTRKVLRAFRFTGDPINGQDPQKIRLFDKLFTLNGNKVSVPDEVADKLATHSHFTEV